MRLHFLRRALEYPSQRGSWIGLFPFFLLHYLFDGTQAIQAVSAHRIRERPHKGDLYYEKRRFASWAEVNDRL